MIKKFLVRAVAVVAPIAAAVARILFTEGRNEVEESIQNAARSIARAVMNHRLEMAARR